MPGTGGTWISSDSSIATITDEGVITGRAGGEVTFTYTDSATGCSNTTKGTITVHNLPIVGLSEIEVCVGENITATPSTDGVWSSSNDQIATVTNAGIVTGLSEGQTTLRYTNTATGCSNITPFAIIVHPLPVVSTSSDVTCVNSTITAMPNTAGTWSSSDSSIATITDGGVITGRAAGEVAFTYTDSVTGCSNTTIGKMTVYNVPIIGVTSNEVCVGSAIQVTSDTDGSWMSSNTDVAIISAEGMVKGISAGIVTVSFKNNNSGCTNTIAEKITVKPLPTLNLSGTEVGVGNTLNATPTTGGTWYSSNNGVATITSDGIITGISEGGVIFTYTDNATGCANQTAEIIRVYEIFTEIPNKLSPNNDGINDYWDLKGFGEGAKIEIRDRWGQVVFETTNYKDEWNGWNLPIGTYYYVINKEGDIYKGFIYLSR